MTRHRGTLTRLGFVPTELGQASAFSQPTRPKVYNPSRSFSMDLIEIMTILDLALQVSTPNQISGIW